LKGRGSESIIRQCLDVIHSLEVGSRKNHPMGLDISKLVGYGDSKGDAWQSFRKCFIYHYGASAWESAYHKESKDIEYIQKGENSTKYFLTFTKDNGMWRCYLPRE
jgi:hypothetical protein